MNIIKTGCLKLILPAVLCCLFMLGKSAYAEDTPAFFFELGVESSDDVPVSGEMEDAAAEESVPEDGNDTAETESIPADQGDVVMVTLTLDRTDDDEPFTMYAMQSAIRYDSTYFEPVTDGISPAQGIRTYDVLLRDRKTRELHMDYIAPAGGTAWESRTLIGTIPMKVIGEKGSGTLACSGYGVSLPDGSALYPAEGDEVRIVVSEEPSAQLGIITTPDSSGNIDLMDESGILGLMQAELAADKLETVREETDEQAVREREPDADAALWADSNIRWQIPLAAFSVALICVLAVMWKKVRKTVTFDCGTGMVRKVRVMAGRRIPSMPEEPERAGFRFTGWYLDEDAAIRRYPEISIITEDVTYYAGWRELSG